MISNIRSLIYELPHELPKNSNEVQRSSWRHSLLSSLPCRNKYLIQALEKNTNTDNIISFLVLSKFTCFYDFSQITSKWFVFRKKHYNLYLTPVSFKFNILIFFVNFESFLSFHNKSTAPELLYLGQKSTLESFQLPLLTTFLINCSYQSQSRIMSTIFQKCKQQMKYCQKMFGITTWKFANF